MRNLGISTSLSAIAVLAVALGVLMPGGLAAAQQSGAPRPLLPAGTFAPPPVEEAPPVEQTEPERPEPQPEQPQPQQPEPLAPESAPPAVEETPLPEAGPEAGPEAETGPETAPVIAQPRHSGVLSRSAVIGLHGPKTGGFGEDLWSGSSGPFVRDLMRDMAAPTASRWAHVLLRRALLSRTPTPEEVLPANFVAERAHLLLRMGEAEGARRLAAQVPVASFTRRMFEVAPHAYLAAGDVPGLCPMVQAGITVSPDPVWPLTSAVCAALQGDDAGAMLTLDRERENRTAKTFDIQLAEVVATTLAGGDRGVNAAWPQNTRLTTYRLGMALAGGVEVPRQRLASANAAVQGWLVRQGAVPLAVRLEAARTAAATGALPTRELIDVWSLQAASIDETAIRSLPVGKLRAAYQQQNPAEKLQALQALWETARSPQDRVALYLAASDAAARLPRDPALVEAAPELGRALLLAGRVSAARGWYELARAEARGGNAQSGAALMRLWPLVAVADAHGRVPRSAALFELWDDAQEGDRADRARRRQLVSAALSGLRLLPMAELPRSARVEPVANSYTRRLRDAANAGRRGEVILLAGLGLGRDAARVSPAYLHEITWALTNVGLRREAGLIAAEILIRNGV